jgi:phosphoserine phosphatase
MIDARSSPEERAAALARVLELNRALAEQHETDAVLGEVLALGMRLLDAEAGTLWVFDAARGELESLLPRLDPPLRLAIGQGLAGACAAERRIINVLDAYEDPRFHRAVDEATGFRTRSMLNVPLVARDGGLIGVLQFLDADRAGYDEHAEQLAAVLAAQCAVALQHARAAERLQQSARLAEEVEVARLIQQGTLPTRMPEVAGYDVHGHFQPAGHAGGDLFDCVMLPQGLLLLLGDATGHGFGPALSATQMQGMLRVALRCGAGLDEAYRHVNNQLAEDLPPERFITAFVGFLDPATHEVRYHAGGQGPILHFRAATGTCDWHAPTSFPLGVLELDAPPAAVCLRLEPGDVLAVLSDGLYEYPNGADELFGEQGVAAVVRRAHAAPMRELSEELLRAAQAFGAGREQADDITLLLLRRLSG